MQGLAFNIIASRNEKTGAMRTPRRGRKAPRGRFKCRKEPALEWAGLELRRRKPLGRAASYRQRILLTRDALRRFLASKGFFVGLDKVGTPRVRAVERARKAQVMSEACRKLRRASCCVIGTLRTHTIRCQRGPTKNNRADAESPLKSRPFRLDVWQLAPPRIAWTATLPCDHAHS